MTLRIKIDGEQKPSIVTRKDIDACLQGHPKQYLDTVEKKAESSNEEVDYSKLPEVLNSYLADVVSNTLRKKIKTLPALRQSCMNLKSENKLVYQFINPPEEMISSKPAGLFVVKSNTKVYSTYLLKNEKQIDTILTRANNELRLMAETGYEIALPQESDQKRKKSVLQQAKKFNLLLDAAQAFPCVKIFNKEIVAQKLPGMLPPEVEKSLHNFLNSLNFSDMANMKLINSMAGYLGLTTEKSTYNFIKSMPGHPARSTELHEVSHLYRGLEEKILKDLGLKGSNGVKQEEDEGEPSPA